MDWAKHKFKWIISLGLVVALPLGYFTVWVERVEATTADITVQVWGGGGSGAVGTSQASGGGGGAYSSSVLTLGIGTYTVTVAAAKAPPTGDCDNATGNTGDDSWFQTSSTVMAKGGQGARTGSGQTASGGAAASGFGDTKYSGGNGTAVSDPSYSGGGESGGPNGNGNNSSTQSGNGGTAAGGTGNANAGDGGTGYGGDPGFITAPQTPGGGAGGARSCTQPNSSTQSGARGEVRVSYDEGTVTATGGTINTVGGTTTHTFTSSGTFEITDVGGGGGSPSGTAMLMGTTF